MRLVQRLQVQTGKGVEMLPPCELMARATELESGREETAIHFLVTKAIF